MPCKNPQCHVEDDDKCIEGFSDLQECPHYSVDGGSEPEETREVEVAKAEDDSESDIALPSGGALDLAAAGERVRSTGSIIVSIIGSTGSGKTTLVSSIYDLLGRDEALFDYAFSGSDTLFAFERLCHLARAASGREIPDTEHTSHQSGLTFLHLELVHQASLERTHLLFSDRSGEDYQAATHRRDACRELVEVAGAGVILLLVDAERLLDPVSRQPALAQVRTMVGSLIDAGMTNCRQRLLVALTKFDLIKGIPEEAEVLGSFGHVFSQLQQLFGAEFAAIGQVRIASRPTRNTVEPGTGLRQLLEECTREPVVLPDVAKEPITSVREFDKVRE